MTKLQEIARLRSLVNSMGKDSYLGPWLARVAVEAESLIRSDIIPDIDLVSVISEIRERRENAQKEADTILANAHAEATRLVSDARQQREYIMGRAADTLRALLRDIGQ